MNLGDQKRFGIEFELDAAKLNDPELSAWLYGRVRWWSNGERIGLHDDDTVIADVAREAEGFLAYEGRRRDDECFALSTEELYRRITYALFDDHEQSDEQVQADEERYRRFKVKPDVDVFDPWTIFLIEGDSHARLIWRRHDEPDLHECTLRTGEFDEVLKRFLVALPSPCDSFPVGKTMHPPRPDHCSVDVYVRADAPDWVRQPIQDLIGPAKSVDEVPADAQLIGRVGAHGTHATAWGAVIEEARKRARALGGDGLVVANDKAHFDAWNGSSFAKALLFDVIRYLT